MKKVILLVVLAVFCQSLFVFAQSFDPRMESEYFYHNVPIERIYAYRLGYVVAYRAGLRMAHVYLPMEWFTESGGTGEMIRLGPGNEWPSMTIFYQNGVFSHVRLRVRRNMSHETWGIIPLTTDLDHLFQDVNEIRLEF